MVLVTLWALFLTFLYPIRSTLIIYCLHVKFQARWFAYRMVLSSLLYKEQPTSTSVPSCSRLSGTKYSVTANVGDEEERKEVGSLQETGERGREAVFSGYR